MTRSVMQNLDRHLWRSRITTKTKLHLCRVFILPIMLYRSECWTVNKADIQRIDAADQWCLRRILDIRWHDYVRNVDIRRITNQPPLSSIIKSRLLTFFRHLARMDENADASQAVFAPPPENWRRSSGRPCTTWTKNIHDDLSSLDLGLHEARDLAQKSASLQTDVFAQRYALVDKIQSTNSSYRYDLAIINTQLKSVTMNRVKNKVRLIKTKLK